MRSLKRWRAEYQDNPISSKNLEKRLQFLINLGLDLETAKSLSGDLSNPAVNTSQAEYLLDWWRARLSLISFYAIEDPEPIKSQKQSSLLNYLQGYCKQYHLTPYDLALDGELSLDIYPELRHYIELSISNPYFRTPWPLLHYVIFEERHHYARESSYHWLGYLAKDNIELSSYRYGYGTGQPAILFLRGQYMADPVGSENETEIPKEAITSLEPTGKPSDLIKFLKEAETNLKTARYFIPDVHQPFLTFPDGKTWVVISDEDVQAEARSLGDCGRGQYSDSNIVLISLREPVAGKYYKALLKAEIVFPTDENRDKIKVYEDFAEQKYGIINQLRGYGNSKPPKELHRYIIPLLEQTWIAQNVNPDYRSEANFDLKDLSENELERLRNINPKLFNLTNFYQEFKQLKYPDTLRNQIVDRMSFDVPDLVGMLGEMGRGGGTLEERAIEAGLKKLVLTEKESLKSELYPLLSAAEEAIFRLKTPAKTKKLIEAGAELSITKILNIVDAVLAAMESCDDRSIAGPSSEELWKEISTRARRILGWQDQNYETFKSYFEAAIISLFRKIQRQDKVRGTDEAHAAVGKILLKYASILEIRKGQTTVKESVETMTRRRGRRRRIIVNTYWPPKGLFPNIIVNAKIGLNLTQTQELIKYFINLSNTNRQWWMKLTIVNNYLWRLLLLSLEGLDDPSLSQGLRELILHPTLPYEPVRDLLMEIVSNTKDKKSQISEEVLNFSETQIIDALLKGSDGAIHAALLVLKKQADDKIEPSPKISASIKKFLYRIKSIRIAEEAVQLFDFPLNNLLEILKMPSINRYTRLAALKALRKRLTQDPSRVQKRIYQAIHDLVLRTQDKNLLTKCFDLFEGFQHQYKLLKSFAENRIDWVSAPENRSYILRLIRENLPKSRGKEGYISERTLPKELGTFLQKLVSDNLVKNNCEFLLTILFDARFDKASKKTLTNLTETVLGAVIANPEKLTSDFCHWMEHEPGGWGSHSQRWFPNELQLTKQLLKRFYQLTDLAEKTKNSCYLKLILAIGHRLNHADKFRMSNLVARWTRGRMTELKLQSEKEHPEREDRMYTSSGTEERLKRFMGLRRRRHG